MPEFPGQAQVDAHLPPPEHGEHTVEVLLALGYSKAECSALLDKGAATAFNPAEFTWAPVRDKSQES